MVTRNIIQLVSPYNLPYDQDAPGAYDRFCWGPLCYDYGQYSSFTTEGYLVELFPNETDSTFIADYYPAGVAGVTALEYCFHPVGDVAAGTCQQVLYCLDAENCALNVNESTIDSSPLFPQPVTGLSSFPYQLNGASGGIDHPQCGRSIGRAANPPRATRRGLHDAAAYPAGLCFGADNPSRRARNRTVFGSISRRRLHFSVR